MADDITNGAPAGNGAAPSSPVSAPPPEPTESSFSVREYLRSQEIPVDDFETDQAAFDAVLHAARNPEIPQQLKQYAGMGRQYAALQASPEWNRYQEYLKTGGQQQPQAQPKPDPDEFKWDKYEPDPQWEQYLQVDPKTGAFVPKGDWVDPVAVEKANAYHRNVRQRMQQVLNDFPELVSKASAKKFKEFEGSLEGRFEKYLAQRETAQQARNYLYQNKDQIFKFDDRGAIARDPVTGEEQLEAHGKLLNHYLSDQQQALNELAELGVDLSGVPQQALWTFVQRRAMKQTQTDVGVHNNWTEYLKAKEQAPPAQAAAPATPQDRNQAAKDAALAKAAAARKRNPATNTGASRSVALAADAPSARPKPSDLVRARLGL